MRLLAKTLAIVCAILALNIIDFGEATRENLNFAKASLSGLFVVLMFLAVAVGSAYINPEDR